ncbi:hypothetical protein DQ04_04841000, partial [Trypanosoma grayi]|uniref:hypothetical protein n=1 Tax=Trypanosoma grayi TaxID=71804 RepID=UPI0004F41F94
MSLRKDTLNSLVPFPIASGHIVELCVEIPWPTSNSPLIIRSQGVKVILDDYSLSVPLRDMSMEDIRLSINEESILGVTLSASGVDGENHEEEAASAAIEPAECISEFGSSLTHSEGDDEDYMSCRSEGNSSFVSCESLDDVALLPRDGGGVFSFLRSAASNSVMWIMNRPIQVHTMDVALVLRCDSGNDARFEVVAKELRVQVEPLQEINAEKMKVVNITFSGVSLNACTDTQESKVTTVDSLSVRITSVYNSSGVLCRKNVAVSFDGAAWMFSDEDTLTAITHCLVSRQEMMNVPDFCRPYSDLRRLKSRWPYTMNCVLAFIRDRRRRYNFNPSHLNFYAEARKTYIGLLYYCHRTGDVVEKRDSLAEVEREIRYRDVVMYLRQTVQERYSAASPTGGGTPDADGPSHQSEEAVAVASSVHVNLKVICLFLPSNTKVWIRDVAFVSRIDEMELSVGSVRLDPDVAPQSLHLACGREPLLCVQRTEQNGMVFVKVKLDDVNLTVRSGFLLGVLAPIATAVPRILQVMPPKRNVSQSAPTSRAQTFSLVLPLVQLRFDDLVIRWERLSLTVIERGYNNPRIGFLLKEFSICFGTREVIVPPVKVEMTDTDNVVVSLIVVNVTNTLWEYFCRLVREWNEIILAVRGFSYSKSNKGTSLGVMGVCASLKEVREVTEMKSDRGAVLKSQRLSFRGVECKFCPLKLRMMLGHISVAHDTMRRGGAAFRTRVTSFTLFTDYLNDTLFTVTFANGIECIAAREHYPGTSRILVNIKAIEASWKVASPQTLVHLSDVQIAVCGNTTLCSAKSARLLEAVEFVSLKALYCAVAFSVRTTMRPYIASSLQISGNLVRVCIDRIWCLELEALTMLMRDYATFLVNQVVPVYAYRLFYSGFSNIAVSLCAASCAVTFGDIDDLAFQIGMPSREVAGGSPPLEFGVVLPELRESSPLTVMNACDRLSVVISMPVLYLEMFHCRFPSISIRATLRSFTGTLPMNIQDFWDPALRMREPVPVEMSFDSIILDSHGIASLEFDTVTYNQSSVSFYGEGSTNFSDSEGGSDVSSLVGEELRRTEVRSWSLRANASPGAAIIRDVLGLWGKLRYAFNTLYKKHLIISASVQSSQYDLDITGPWFFDCPDKVVVVEDCTFFFGGGAGGGDIGARMVVCRGTHVYFHRCRFLSPLQSLIAVEDESATFVCKDCEEVATCVNDSDSVTRSESKKVTFYRLRLALQRGGIEVSLAHHRKLTFAISAVDAYLSATSRKSVVQVRVQRWRGEYVDEGVTHCILSRVDVDVDWGVKQIERSASLNAAVRTDTVSVPLSLAVTLRQLVEEWGRRKDGSVVSKRRYTLLQQHNGLPFSQWRGLLTISTIPTELCLQGGIPFAKAIVANAIIWSKQDVNEDAIVEARIGIQELSLWEFSSQAYIPFLQKPLSLVAVARTADFANVKCDVSLSSWEFS